VHSGKGKVGERRATWISCFPFPDRGFSLQQDVGIEDYGEGSRPQDSGITV